MNDFRDGFEKLVADATVIAGSMKINGKTAVRRLLGTADWKHSDERMEAAAAKRERKQARNRK